MSTYTAAVAHSWRVQLADSAPATDAQAALLQDKGYAFDVKWDGVRCLAVVDLACVGRPVSLFTRNAEDMTERWPEVAAALVQMAQLAPSQRFVLDGEIIVFNPETGVPEFRLTSRRKRAKDIAVWAATHPATFVAFDCLGYDDADLRGHRQDLRLQHLETLVPPGNVRVKRSLYDTDGAAMMELVRMQGLEGLIAKDLAAPYRAGRSKRWIKMKPLSSLTAIVSGWTTGTGWREEYFGALELTLLDTNCIHGHPVNPDACPDSDKGWPCVAKPIDIGEVGTGFNRDDLNLIDPLVKAGVELLVEVQYQERTEINPDGTGGKLRFPSFKGLRTDVARDTCTVAQFDRA